jgi:flavin reductase (DIM6/NTAB) family NADH-FMN oxidoreductase RutF
MQRELIPIETLSVRFYHLLHAQWLLLTAGDFGLEQFNTMTVSWGSLGTVWGKPFAQVFVRPSRYTRDFMEQYETFTLSAFPPQYHEALNLLGIISGRTRNKIAEAGLTPIASNCVEAPGFAQAELIIECRKMYWQDMNPKHFLDSEIEANYPHKDYHRCYWGEIVAVMGEEKFRCKA